MPKMSAGPIVRARIASKKTDTRIPAAAEIQQVGEGHPWVDPGMVRLCRIMNNDPHYLLQIFARRRTAPGKMTAPMNAVAELDLADLCRLHLATARAIADLRRARTRARKVR